MNIVSVSDRFTCDRFTCDRFTCDRFTCDGGYDEPYGQSYGNDDDDGSYDDHQLGHRTSWGSCFYLNAGFYFGGGQYLIRSLIVILIKYVCLLY